MRLAALLGCAALVQAGYMTVGMSEPRQCNHSIVEWYGDDGPYHLLLTPTKFKSHGYNIWVPTIPNGTNSYNLSLDQPAGLQYMVTVWGASGIEYAGTTDVLTVLPSRINDSSCFMSDSAIHGLYSFAFNMTNSYNGDNQFPPQCSNLSLSWPTSLESPIPDSRRAIAGAGAGDGAGDGDGGVDVDVAVYTDAIAPPPPPVGVLERTPAPQVHDNPLSDTSSSNKTMGNTTIPPSFFGVIPLGNSFSIPVTYPRNSKFAKTLPQEYLSDNPTTWTSSGVTHMNWTVALAKGTRFIIVAGIGSQEQWASGGSSEMLTVGQGGFECFNHHDGTPRPTITATSSTSGPLNRPTSSGAGKPVVKKEGLSWVVIMLACIFSVLGTLLLVTMLFCCCRVRNQRNKARQEGAPTPGILSVATYGRLGKKRPPGVKRYNQGEYSTDLQLDLIGRDRDRDDAASDSPSSRSGVPQSRPGTDYSTGGYRDSPLRASGYSNASFTSRSPTADDPPYPYFAQQTASPIASPSLEATYSSDMRDLRERHDLPRHDSRPSTDLMSRQTSVDLMGRQTSVDLMGRQSSVDGYASPIRNPRPLQLHDPSQLDDPRGSDDITDLKRETLALLQNPPSPRAGPSRRRRTEDTYVIHQDGGRVASAPTPGRVLELPPRYEELNWETADTDSALPRRFDAANIPLPPSPVITSQASSPVDSAPSLPGRSPDSRAPSIPPPSLRSPSTAPSIPPGAEEPHPPGTGSRKK